MRLRVDASVASALAVAEFLDADRRIAWTKYPFLKSHPQYDLARKQMAGGGTVVTFEIADRNGVGGKERVFEVLNKLRVAKISNNLGDSKTLVTHRRRPPTVRWAEGAQPSASPIRSCGSPSGWRTPEDLINDLDQALVGRSRRTAEVWDRYVFGRSSYEQRVEASACGLPRSVENPRPWTGTAEVWDPWEVAHLRNPALTGTLVGLLDRRRLPGAVEDRR